MKFEIILQGGFYHPVVVLRVGHIIQGFIKVKQD